MRLTLYEMCLFSMFGALMFGSKKIMEFLPNIHLIGMFVVLLTVVYRTKALIPLYIYVFLDGVFGGFNLWWIPYLYVWTVLWGMAMLIPKKIPSVAAAIVYPVVCSLHGFLFGILYAPAQALFFKLSFEQTVSWVLAGSLFDTVHGISNLIVGLLIFPLSVILKKLNSSVYTRIA
ncbi:MAG: hypothetical protein IKB72_05500 [Ruminococcus sp.]|nr:hypothetical protein [Oscillospiraceae bacterium]MBR2724873.1 hypothetical protein [Ruminococcus sp.]